MGPGSCGGCEAEPTVARLGFASGRRRCGVDLSERHARTPAVSSLPLSSSPLLTGAPPWRLSVEGRLARCCAARASIEAGKFPASHAEAVPIEPPGEGRRLKHESEVCACLSVCTRPGLGSGAESGFAGDRRDTSTDALTRSAAGAALHFLA